MRKEYSTPQIVLSMIISEGIIATSVSSNLDDLKIRHVFLCSWNESLIFNSG